MPVFTSAGTKVLLVKAPPATYDAAGYTALKATAIEVGEVSDLGDTPSRVYDVVTWRNIANRGESKAKGGYTLGSQTVTVGIDPDDAGQDLVDAATEDDDAYTVIQSHPRLGDICSRALVMGGPKSYGDVNTVATRQLTFEHTIVSQDEDGLVYIPPA